MVEKFVAIAPKGREYLYKRESMIAVPKASATNIAKTLNDSRYKLKDNEVWHVYDNDWYTNDYIIKEIKRYSDDTKKIKIYPYYDA